jgi:hypothetical protein
MTGYSSCGTGHLGQTRLFSKHSYWAIPDARRLQVFPRSSGTPPPHPPLPNPYPRTPTPTHLHATPQNESKPCQRTQVGRTTVKRKAGGSNLINVCVCAICTLLTCSRGIWALRGSGGVGRGGGSRGRFNSDFRLIQV